MNTIFSVETRLEKFRRKYNPWTWPNKHFPFRLYYDGKNCRIFIIENILHNFEWLKECCRDIRPTDHFIVYVGWYFSEEACRQSKELCDILGITDRIWIMYNDHDEMSFGSAVGFGGDLVNHNCWIDWNIFDTLETEKKYDAIYVARALPFKRHWLASKIDNLALVVGDKHGDDDEVPLPEARYRNEKPLDVPGVVSRINESRVGLCLSNLEGASFTSSEYLLCGVPVVSTKSKGGRSIWYDENNSIICEDDDPESVRDAVDRMIRMGVDGKAIRERHIEKSKGFRERFIYRTQKIMSTNSEGVDAWGHFAEGYFDKLRRSENVKMVRELF